MIRVYTGNHRRPIWEMDEMFSWCVKTFGEPSIIDSEGKKTGWSYGKSPGMFGSKFVDGPFDIEYLDFYNHEDATVFKLSWATTQVDPQ